MGKIERFEFKKGDEIPQFIERYSEKYFEGTFGIDVIAIRQEPFSNVAIYPLNRIENGYTTMIFKPINGVDMNSANHEELVIYGMPTTVYNNPIGCNDNIEIFTIN